MIIKYFPFLFFLSHVAVVTLSLLIFGLDLLFYIYYITATICFYAGAFISAHTRARYFYIRKDVYLVFKAIFKPILILSLLYLVFSAGSEYQKIIMEQSVNYYRNMITKPEADKSLVLQFFPLLFFISLISILIGYRKLGWIIGLLLSIVSISRSRILDITLAFLIGLKNKKYLVYLAGISVISLYFAGIAMGRHSYNLYEFLSSYLERFYVQPFVFQELYFTTNESRSSAPISIDPLLLPFRYLGDVESNLNILYQANPLHGWVGYTTPGMLGFLVIDFGHVGSLTAAFIFGLLIGYLLPYAKDLSSTSGKIALFLLLDFWIFSFFEIRTANLWFVALMLIVPMRLQKQ